MADASGSVSVDDIAVTLHRAGRSAAAGSMAAGVIISVIMWSPGTGVPIVSWLVLLAAVAAWRVHGMRRFARARARGTLGRPERWIDDFDRRMAVSGLAWAVGGYVFCRYTDLTGHVLFALCICGLTAGAVAAFFVHLRTVFAFATPAVVPFSMQLMVSPERVDIVLGGSMLIFGAIVAIVAVQVHDSLDHALPRSESGDAGLVDDRPLDKRRVEHLYRTAMLTATASVLAAATVVFILRDVIDLQTAALWIAGVVAATGLRMLKVDEFRRGSDGDIGPGYWLTNFNYPLFLVGIVWTTGAIVLPSQEYLLGDMLMTICVFGLVAGAVAGFSSHMSAVLSLSLPSVVPYAIHLLATGGSVHVSLGIALLVFSSIVVLAGLRVGRLVREGFAHELENIDLIDTLKRRNREIESLNQELESRVRLRTEELRVLVQELREKTGQLSDSQRQYYNIVEKTNELIFGIDDAGELMFANHACRTTLGLTDAALDYGLQIRDLATDTSADIVSATLAQLSAGKDVTHVEFALVARSGEIIHLSGGMRPGLDAQGDPASFGVFSNVTSHKEAEAALQTSEARFRAIFERGSIGILILDPGFGIVEANDRALAILRPRGDALTHARITELVKPAYRAYLEQNLQAMFDGALDSVSLEMETEAGPDATIWGQYDINIIEDAEGEVRFAAAMLQDVSERRVLADALSFNASHDYLTGLINRREFERCLANALDDARPEYPYALVYLDLDRFKLINDTCGHATGDALLRELSAELKRIVPADCSLARIGGDEFALLVPGTSTGEVHVLARSLIESIAAFDFEQDGRHHSVGASAGIVMMDGTETLQEILQEADAACYAAKRAGHNRIEIYNANKDDMRLQRDQIRAAAALADALHEDQLTLYAQPIAPVDQSGASIERYELLLRLISYDGTVNRPGELLPAAERYGYVTEVDQWVVQRTLEMLSQTDPVRIEGLMLCVNLSGHSLLNEAFSEFLAGQLERHDFGKHICFEITESQFISNLPQATRLMRRVRSYGCRFSLDDFGTGFSSYGYLKELDVDYLKIDGTFIRDIDTNTVDEAIVSSIAGVARAIGKQTVAEYVERASQLEILGRLRVDMVQGHAIGLEVPLESVLARAAQAQA